MADSIPKELDDLSYLHHAIYADFPNEESLIAEINKFSQSLPNAKDIIARTLSLAYGSRYRSKEVLEKVSTQIGVALSPPYYVFEFTPNDILNAIVADKPDDLTGIFDKEAPEGKKLKLKLFGKETEIDYLAFAALTGSSSVYNMLLRYNLKPDIITLVCAVISGHSELISNIISIISDPPIKALLRIALLAHQKDVFNWFLDQFVLPKDETEILFLFISKTQEIPEDAFTQAANIEKIDFTFNNVFESDDIAIIKECVYREFISGPNLGPQAGPIAAFIKDWLIKILKAKISSGKDHRSELILGNLYRLSNVNSGPIFEVLGDEMRILRYKSKPNDFPQLGNNYDFVPKEALELFKKVADDGDKSGEQLFQFYRMFGPKEYLPDDAEYDKFAFDEKFNQKVFGVDRSAVYAKEYLKYLTEKYYNPPRFIEKLEEYIFNPNDGTGVWRDFNFLYGTAIYAGMIPEKNREEGALRMIKFALYGFSYPRLSTLLFYQSVHPEYFPADKINLKYVEALKGYLEYLHKQLKYNLPPYKLDDAYN